MSLARPPWSFLACVGWGLSWLYVGLVLLVEITSCTSGRTDSWLVSLVAGAPLAVVALSLLAAARRRAGATRWLALPHALLLPPAALLVARYFSLSTLHGMPLCAIAAGESGYAAAPAQWWNRWWAPAHAVLLAALGALVFSYWRGWRVDERHNAPTPH